MSISDKTKKRIFDIIQIGKKDDVPSRLFDLAIVVAILLNSSVLVLDTFSEMAQFAPILNVIEAVTVVFFCVEYALRIWTAEYLYPNKSKSGAVIAFLLSFDGIVDLMTILPFFYLSGFVAFRLLRVIRIFHLFRINAAYDSFNVITSVLYEKRNQIFSSVFIIFILMLGSSITMYSVEHEAQPEVFQNAFSGIWWSLSTIFTVGYGDIYPITTLGRVLAIVTTILGVGVVAIPTGIISAGFVEQYNEAQKAVPDSISAAKAVMIEKDSVYCGKSVKQLKKEYGVNTLVIIREGMTMLPSAYLVLNAGDTVVLEKE